ncbi:SDR family NAD(P)-dependent oxidoreductase [Paenibacillus sp. HJGM_3]|uniref:SDR family NAD(P)-dependent oxidoreductase n=1 Tax=Paenibacillus sp. HJGM_3 TaxID=3379816 RepID=UPI00385C7235
MASQLQDKVIVITGSMGAAGGAAVKLFLESGAFVAACDIKAENEFSEKALLLERFGSNRLLYVQADMNEESQVQNLFTRVSFHFGRLDGSFHTTYTNLTGRIEDQSLQDWEASTRGTLTSTFLVTKYAAKLMADTGGGSIVNVSSVLGTIPKKANAAYGAGKAGIEQFTRVAAVEYAKYGIRANTIVPGDFKSEESLARFTEQQKEEMRQTTLVGRSGFAVEIAEVAAFLLSDASSYVTGSLYPVTGGIWLSPDRNV